jgi:peptidoglycan/LPS O-acetylase OafA/YrhL
MTDASKRVPALDGWRGIAVLMVLLTHAQLGLYGHYYGNHEWLNLGQHGVTLFFIISGYIITKRLSSHQEAHLPSFYVRRFFRLMPVAWAYLLVIAIFSYFSTSKATFEDFLACLLFFRNFHYGSLTQMNGCMGHFWSLSIEEQFYFFWPLVLVAGGRFKALCVAVIGIIACASIRLAYWDHYSGVFTSQHTEVRLDALLVGCAMALILDRPGFAQFIRCHASLIFPFSLLGVSLFIYKFHVLVPLTETLLMALMVATTIFSPTMLPTRFLEQEHMRFLGLISYSVYIWQLVPAGVLFLPILAFLSYFFIERNSILAGSLLCERLFAIKPSVGNRSNCLEECIPSN